MPLYEYQCGACGKVSEHRHGFGESLTEACTSCGGELVRRFSPAGIVFKGPGFYVTDSRKASEAKSAAAKSDSASADGKSDRASADGTKPDSGKSDSAPKAESAPASSGGSDSAAKKGGDAAA